jgi:hypothetical protein
MKRFEGVLNSLWLALYRNKHFVNGDVRRKIVKLVRTNLFDWETQELRRQREEMYLHSARAPWLSGEHFDLLDEVDVCVETFTGNVRDYAGLRMQKIMLKCHGGYYSQKPHWRWLD